MLLQTTTGLAATISILDLNSQWSNGWTGTEGRASRRALGACGRSPSAGGGILAGLEPPGAAGEDFEKRTLSVPELLAEPPCKPPGHDDP